MTCPICGNTSAAAGLNALGRDASLVNCTHCGKFGLTGSLAAALPSLLLSRDAAPKLSHVVRKAHETGQQLLLNSYTVEAILENPLPRPREQADLLIQWLALNSPGPGEPLELNYDLQGAVVGAKSHPGFLMLIEHLTGSGLVTGPHNTYVSGESFAHVALTFAGWDYYESLRLGGATYRKAFMAMKFGDPDLNSFLDQVLKPAAKRAGFDLFKLDDKPMAGLIDDRMRVEIRASDFVVADLTHDNLGAYWEAGYAEGLGKPVIYTCERSKFEFTRTHFDTNHHLTIVWDVAAPEEAGRQLVATIRATLPHLAQLADA
ncbi:MAG: hypothetical protein WC091_23435 [Sulfuricellaceae bacterium]